MGRIQVSVYITAQTVNECGSDPAELRRMIDDITAVGAKKVFIETWRGGGIVEEDTLRSVKAAFEAEGFETATGIMPVRGRDPLLEGTDDWDSHKTLGGNSRWGADICYSRPWSREEIRRALKRGAAVFDEYIIDDALCTQCTCTYCREKRGDKSWVDYRQDLLVDVSREDIVGAAREVNPNIRMILKFPQWYDRLHCYGYDTARQPTLFDATWIGTETRDPDTGDFGYTPQYEGFFNVRWHKDAGPNLQGSWFDYIECDPVIYAEQAFQSVLGGVTNLTLFCYTNELFRSNGYLLAALKAAMPRLERIAERIDSVSPTGVLAYRPHNAHARDDAFVFDGLGYVGMPLVPTVTWPKETPKAALFTDHLAKDPELTNRVRAIVTAGGTAFITASVIEHNDDNEELKELAGLQKDGWVQMSSWQGTRYRVGDRVIESDTPVPFRFDMRVETATPLAEVGGVAHHRTEWTPVVTRQEHSSGGAVVVLNVSGASMDRDFRMDENLNVPIPLPVQFLPAEVLAVMQGEIAKAVGRSIVAPARVSYYPFESGDIFVENFRDQAVSVRFAGKALADSAKEEFGASVLKKTENGDWVLHMQPRTVALIING